MTVAIALRWIAARVESALWAVEHYASEAADRLNQWQYDDCWDNPYAPPNIRPRPTVVSTCENCLGSFDVALPLGRETITLEGVAHYGFTNGMTRCGKDATGDRWWWPL